MFEFASAAAKGFHRSSQYRAKIKTGTVSLCIEELLGTVDMDCGEGWVCLNCCGCCCILACCLQGSRPGKKGLEFDTDTNAKNKP